MSNKYQYTYELWKEQSQHITSSPSHWMDFLKTAAWTYKYRFEDQILIYAQRPDAKACADYDTWNNKMHRWIMFLIFQIQEVQPIAFYDCGKFKRKIIMKSLK